jgi:peptidoglycan/LPS O-acetylase OafA/YrhL
MIRARTSRSTTLDALRGVAILEVVLWHYIGYLSPLPSWLPYRAVSLGWSGVDLFFVLSGFLIGGGLFDSVTKPRYFSTFYGRRVFRIFPLYCIALPTVVLFVDIMFGSSSHLFFEFIADPKQWIPYLTFTQNIDTAVHGNWRVPWAIVTWSLAIEEQFYLILPTLIWFTPRRQIPRVVCGCIIAAPICRTLATTMWGPLPSFLLFPCRMDSLFLGVLAAHMVRDSCWVSRLQSHRRHLGFCVVGLLVGMATLTGNENVSLSPLMTTIGLSWIGMTYFAILLYAVGNPRIEQLTASYGFPLCWIGIGSYFIYLFHGPALIMPITAGIVQDTFSTRVWAILCCLAFAWISWRWIEKPAIDLAHRLFPGNGGAHAIAPLGSPLTKVGFR